MKAKPRYRMISWVAEKYNVHPQTLRLWEREGLIQPARSRGNTRLYDEETCERLETILNNPQAKVAALKTHIRLHDQHGVGDATAPLQTYRKILALDGRDVSALLALEQLALNNGDRRLLAEVDRQLIAISDDPISRATYRARLGNSLEQDQSEEALGAYLDAVAEDPTNYSAICEANSTCDER